MPQASQAIKPPHSAGDSQTTYFPRDLLHLHSETEYFGAGETRTCTELV